MANDIRSASEVLQKLNTLWSEHAKLINQANEPLKKYTDLAKLPSNYAKNLKDVVAVSDKLTKSTAELTKTEKQLQAQQKADIILRNKRIKAFDDETAKQNKLKTARENAISKSMTQRMTEYVQGLGKTGDGVNKLNSYYKDLERSSKKQADALKKEALALEKNAGLYNKVQQRVRALTTEYNQLATKKALGMNLDRAELSSLKQITLQLNKYDTVLKKVDADVGKHQRNVGNYKKAYDGLGWSVTQLAREAPAFANSIQTGFMAISNNLPMLFDELANAKREVAGLRAEGKQTTGVLGRLAKSIFSFQTLLSVGVTLLTLYGKDLVIWASALLGGDQVVKNLAENTKKLNKESAQIASQSIPKFQALVNIITDVTTSEKKRLNAINELKKSYPDFNSEILKEKDNTDLVNDAVSEYINKIGQKAKAQASMTMMQEKYNALIVAEQKANEFKEKTVLKLAKAQNKEIKTIEQAVAWIKKKSYDTESSNKTLTARNRIENNYESILSTINKHNKSQADIQKEINALMNVYVDNADLAAEKTGKLSGKKEEYNHIAEDSIKGMSAQISELEELRDATSYGTTEWNIYNELLKALQYSFDKLTESAKESKKAIDTIGNGEGTLAGLIDENDINGVRQALRDKELEDVRAFEKKKAEIYKKYAEMRQGIEANISQNIRDILASSIDAIFQKQLDGYDEESALLATKTERLVSFEGDNAEAVTEINRQAAIEEAKIQEKRAETEKKAFLLKQAFEVGEIAINTIKTVAALKAQAAVLLSNPVTAPLAPVALSQIPIVIAGGAVAGASVLAQSIPAFKDGVRDFIGGNAIVGDGGKHEYIRTPDGKVSKTPNTDTLVNLPTGTDVFKD